jgi:hypothetical protein
MADLTGVTAVRPAAIATQTRIIPYGATIAAGQPVVRVAGVAVLADADASEALAEAEGVAITPGVDGGFGIVAFGGSIVLVGTTMSVGTTYYVSPTAGGIMPAADLASGDFVTRLGTAASATQLDLSIEATGIEVPA